MGYLTDGLTFNVLREANIKRLTQFKNAKGELSHPTGINDWSLSQWSNAVAGEVGEAANIIKKIERGDFSFDDEKVKMKLAEELADIQTYLDLLALRAGINLGVATVSKFNQVSERVGSNVFMTATDWHYDNERGKHSFNVNVKEA